MALMMVLSAMVLPSCSKDDDGDPQSSTSTTNSGEQKEETTTETKDEKTTKTDTEIIKDSNGNPVGTRTTTTTTINGQTTVEVVLKDMKGDIIDNDATFTVKYHKADGIEGTLPAAQSGKFGETVTVAGQGNLSNGEWEFGGWNTKADGSGTTFKVGSTITLTENLDLHALWTINYSYAILFDPNGATDGQYQEVFFINDKDFKEIELPTPTLTKGDLVFKGWCANAEGTVYEYDYSGTYSMFPAGTFKEGDSYFSKFRIWLISNASIMTNYTATLYAIYGAPESEKTGFKYNIVFNSNGYEGTLPEAIGFDDYKTATFKFPYNTFTAPSSDMVFVGWKVEAPNSNIATILHGLFEKTYSVEATWSYVDDDNLLDPISYNFKYADKSTVTLTPIFAKKSGTLNLSNNSGSTYTIFIDGEAKGYLDDGKSANIEDLKLNTEHSVEIYKYDKDAGTYSKITKTSQTFTFTKAGEKQMFSFPELATVTVKHSSTNTYKVWIDDLLTATWTKSGTYSFEVSPEVQHKIYVEQQNGYLINPTKGTKNFTLEAGGSVTYSGPVSSTSTTYFK